MNPEGEQESPEQHHRWNLLLLVLLWQVLVPVNLQKVDPEAKNARYSKDPDIKGIVNVGKANDGCPPEILEIILIWNGNIDSVDFYFISRLTSAFT